MARLTELDNCVLGVVWRSGPLSAYRVRSFFALSTTASWSASAGSIYPSISRLIAAGLVAAEAPHDRRGTQVLRITGEGLDALGRWMLDVSEAEGAPTPDPIRTRAQFLTSIGPGDRRRFIAAAQASTRTALAGFKALPPPAPHDDLALLDHLGTLGAIAELEARLAWLEEISKMIGVGK